MLIDVGDSTANLVLNVCLGALVLVAVLSLLPLGKKAWPWQRWLPVVALLTYALYERTMPANWDIRLDLVLITPIMLIVLVAWLWRLVRRHF